MKLLRPVLMAALLSVPAFPQKSDFPLTVHITAVTAEQGQNPVYGHGSTDTEGKYSSTVSGGGSYTWTLYTAHIDGNPKAYGLSTPRIHYKGGKGLAVATLGWSAVATARPNHSLHIGAYAGRWNADGTLELQFADEKGKLIHQTFKVESEETAASAAQEPSHSADNHVQQDSAAAAPRNGVCKVSSSPEGADIEVDGSFVGNTPSEISLTEGEHLVEIKKSGFGTWQRKLKVASGSSVNLSAVLEKP